MIITKPFRQYISMFGLKNPFIESTIYRFYFTGIYLLFKALS